MLSLPDMAILGGIALIVFGPEKLPGIARQAGRVMGEMRATSGAFVREMERAAIVDPPGPAKAHVPEPPAALGSTDSGSTATH